MELLYKNQFVKISLDKAHGIIEMVWLPAVTHMSDEDFKQVFTRYAELAEQYHPTFYLTYSEGEDYVIMPHLQEWVAENIIPRTHQAGVAFTAIVVSEDIFARVSAKQLLDEKNAQLLTSCFFSDRTKAREWLIKLHESSKVA